MPIRKQIFIRILTMPTSKARNFELNDANPSTEDTGSYRYTALSFTNQKSWEIPQRRWNIWGEKNLVQAAIKHLGTAAADEKLVFDFPIGRLEEYLGCCG